MTLPAWSRTVTAGRRHGPTNQAAGQHIEALTTYGSATTEAVNFTGNELANTLVGNAAANVLDGKGGADIMWGYAGNDTYYVDNSADQIGGEGANGGSDWVIANANFALGAGQQVELLTTYGSAMTNAINLSGNEFANTIVGNAAGNMIDGKGGIDSMRGYAGNDTYFVDNAADGVTEAAGGGSDSVITNVGYTLAAGQEIETLRTYGSAVALGVDLTGNAIANTIVGDDGDNSIDGKGGSDILYGYAGLDLFAFTTAPGRAMSTASATSRAGSTRSCSRMPCSPPRPGLARTFRLRHRPGRAGRRRPHRLQQRHRRPSVRCRRRRRSGGRAVRDAQPGARADRERLRRDLRAATIILLT